MTGQMKPEDRRAQGGSQNWPAPMPYPMDEAGLRYIKAASLRLGSNRLIGPDGRGETVQKFG